MSEGRAGGSLWAIAGGLVAMGAVAAIAAWLVGSAALTRPLPELQPVHPDAALGLVFCGLGLALGAARGVGQRGATASGVLATAVGLAALAGYVWGVELGIYRALSRVLPAASAPAPAPAMPPSVAFGLVFAGVAVVVRRRLPLLRCALAAGCIALSLSAALSYATGVQPTYGWDSWTLMAPPTAASLAVLGLALGLLRGPSADSVAARQWRVPLQAGLSSAVATLFLCQALSMQQDAQLRLLIDAGASRLRAEVRSRLEERMEALELLASVWTGRFFPSREAWESDAELIMSQSPGLKAIEWVESAGGVKWVYPPDIELPALDPASLEPHVDATRAIVLGGLRLSARRPALRILAPLRGGDRERRGWLSRILRGDGRDAGWLAGVFSTQELLSDLVAPLNSSYVIRIASRGLVFFETEGAVWDPDSPWVRELVLDFPGGLRLSAWVQPSAELLDARRSQLAPVLLAGGLVMSTLLALALGLANVSRGRAVRLEGEIGDRRRAEEEVRRLNDDLEDRVNHRTLELTRSNKDLRQFAAFLSHELRQPIATQAVWAELLEARSSDLLDDQGRHYLEEIRTFATRIGESIDAQLALFSVTGAELSLEHVDLRALLEGLLADLKERLESQHAEIYIGDLPVVRADARLLRQLFRNLLENSLNYRRVDVPLVVRVQQGTPTSDAPEALEIVVQDNGRGFAPEEAERIFEAGGRLGSEPGGSGLGLAVCRRIAERHGGQVVAEGRPGVGAVFRLRLPRTLDASEQDAPTSRQPSGERDGNRAPAR